MRQYRTTAITPVGIHILVEPLEQAAPEHAQLHRVATSDEAPSIGQIISLGGGSLHPQHGELVIPGKHILRLQDAQGVIETYNRTYDVGDVILYRKYAGAEIELNDTKLLVLAPDDVLGLAHGEFIGEQKNPDEKLEPEEVEPSWSERSVPLH